MQQIDVDFQVYKELMYRRNTEEEDFNDVLRKLLNLPPQAKPNGPLQKSKPWVSEGVTFEHGTEFRGKVKGRLCQGSIVDGQFFVEGESAPFAGFSPAAKSVLGY